MFSVELIWLWNKYKIQYRSYKWTTAIIKVELSVFIVSVYYHLSANGPLWYRGFVFSLISHSEINWVLQVSECRIRPLLSDAKIITANMPDFGVEGWWKIRIIFICSRICNNPLFQEIVNLAGSSCGFHVLLFSGMVPRLHRAKEPSLLWEILTETCSWVITAQGELPGQRDESQPSFWSINLRYHSHFQSAPSKIIGWHQPAAPCGRHRWPEMYLILLWLLTSDAAADVQVWGLNNTDPSPAKIKRKHFSLVQPRPGFPSQWTGDTLTDAVLLKAR